MTAPSSAPPLALRLHPDDDVLIALCPLLPGTRVGPEGVVVAEPIPSGHKIAARAIAADAAVHRYGQIIGFATTAIEAGRHIHDHNLSMRDFARDAQLGKDARPTAFIDPPATFDGIVRADGRVATRNYVGILTSVNCSATVARMVADAFRPDPLSGRNPLADFPNVDGVIALTHKLGCGMESRGEGMTVLRRTIAGYAQHPNFAAVVVLGLGCEANQIPAMLAEHGLSASDRLHAMTIQDSGGAAKAVRVAVERVRELLPAANQVVRRPVAARHLTVGLQCGGSDGLSGITANPALGVASDWLVRHGGTVILSETPETWGAEHLLARRATRQELVDKMAARFQWWLAYTQRNGATMDSNPSPGNKAGGLTTILEKSLGAVAKAGSTNLVDVLEYAEAVRERGFVFMDTPGYDPVSATGQIAGGANLICFTTGRGSVFGSAPAPTLKLATNSAMYRRMSDDMDVDCGAIAEGRETLEACGRRIFDQLLRLASGERSKSEAQGFGEAEFAPWPIGAVM